MLDRTAQALVGGECTTALREKVSSLFRTGWPRIKTDFHGKRAAEKIKQPT